LARLKQALHDHGQDWTETLRDRRRSEGASAQHVLHEVLTTEFLLQTWEAAQATDDVEILATQRRSLAKHDAFKVIVGGQSTRLQPDGMFIYRQKGKGMMACFVEMDLDSMSLKQMAAKFRRYQAWAESPVGNSYLKTLYGRHGATAPSATFRILMIVSSRDTQPEHQRLTRLVELAGKLQGEIRNRIWLTTVSDIQKKIAPSPLFLDPIWHRARDGLNVPQGDGSRMHSMV